LTYASHDTITRHNIHTLNLFVKAVADTATYCERQSEVCVEPLVAEASLQLKKSACKEVRNEEKKQLPTECHTVAVAENEKNRYEY
jgi:hypothetical protein